MKQALTRCRIARFMEPTVTSSGTSSIIARTMRVYDVVGSNEDAAAELCAYALGGFNELYSDAGKLPWLASVVSGHPGMAFSTDAIDKLLAVTPLPASLAHRYHLLSQKKCGSLIYYSNPEHIANSRTKFYNSDQQDFIGQDSLGVYLNEDLLMNKLIETKKFDHSWVKTRIKDWENGYLLPNQWMTFNLGMALQFMRLRVYFSQYSNELRDILAWETLWLGKRRKI